MYLVNDIIKLKRKISGIRSQKVRILDVNDTPWFGIDRVQYLLGSLKDGNEYLWIHYDLLDAEYVMNLDGRLKDKKPKLWTCNPSPV